MRGVPLACSTEDLDKLRESQRNKHRLVTVTVNGCAYSCCGKGWQRRDGYEQRYTGYIDNLTVPTDEEAARGMHGTFMLYSGGLGTLSYVIACRFFELADVQFA
jgi:Fe-S-cluster containining protein